MIDNFTKYVKLYKLRQATTTATINKIKLYCEEMGRPSAVLTDNGTQFTSQRWLTALTEMGIKPKYTAVRNPCTNLAERINRQLGNMFRALTSERHTKWAQFLNLVEACINQTYHETIETTPYEAQWGRKPERDWTKYLDKEMMPTSQPINYHNIYLRIKEKGEKRTNRINAAHQISKFQIGDKVLLRAYPISDINKKIIGKFCNLFEGPYKITKELGTATYQLEDARRPEEILIYDN